MKDITSVTSKRVGHRVFHMTMEDVSVLCSALSVAVREDGSVLGLPEREKAEALWQTLEASE